MIELPGLVPAAEEAWWLLFELAEEDLGSWTLVGGQMVNLIAAEFGVLAKARPTEDLDVLVDVRVRPGGTEWLSHWLDEREFRFIGVSPEGVGHRFERPVSEGWGRTIVDVLAPEGLGERTSRATLGGGRTVEVPGGTQALHNSEVVEVNVSGMLDRPRRQGRAALEVLVG